jgi:hypothetical protein
MIGKVRNIVLYKRVIEKAATGASYVLVNGIRPNIVPSSDTVCPWDGQSYPSLTIDGPDCPSHGGGSHAKPSNCGAVCQLK